MPYKSSILENSLFLNPDVSVEMNYRDLWASVDSKLLSCGLVNTADAGQFMPYLTAHARTNSLYNVFTNNPNTAMDGTVTSATGFRSNFVPTSGAPVKWYLDLGTAFSSSLIPASMRIYTYTNVFDPKTYTLDYADTVDPANPDAAVWTSIQSQAGGAIPALAASNTAFQNLTAPAAAHRWLRVTFTDTQTNTATYLQVPEIEFYTAVSGGGTKFSSLVAAGPSTATSTQTSNYRIYRFNDFGAANGFPFFLKVWLGSGTVAGSPSLWIQGGTSTDGAGNFTGASQTTAVLQLASAATNMNTTYRTVFSGNQVSTSAASSDGRLSLSLFYNLTSAPITFSVERSKNIDGTDDYSSANAAVYIVAFNYNGTTRFCMTVPKTGVVPATTADSNIFLNSDGTNSSLRGSNIGLEPWNPYLGPRQNPLMGVAGYWLGEATVESLVTQTLYGATHTYFPLGNNITGVSRGAVANSRLALRYE